MSSAFSYPEFRLFQVGRFLSTVAVQMQSVAVGWQVYAASKNPLDLGYVGLAQFMPAILLTLLAGDAADRFDRRRVLLLSRWILAACSTLLLALAWLPSPRLWPIYCVLVLVGVGRVLGGPSAHALLPNLVPKEHFSGAVAWSSSVWQIAVIAGPAAGGLLYGWTGKAWPVYATCTALEASAALFTIAIRTRSGAHREVGRMQQRLFAGLVYVYRNKLILGAISLDLFAVLFGGAVALLPVYARDILGVGPSGLGLLRSAPAIGAGVVAVMFALRPLPRRAGPTMLVSVFVFGVATIVFGLSRNFMLSTAALVVVGATDMVSVYVRQTVIQLATPDSMRGRVSAVNLTFVSASNELGEFESGATAALLGTVPAVVIGGAATCAVVALWTALFPSLRRIDQLSSVLVKEAQSSKTE